MGFRYRNEWAIQATYGTLKNCKTNKQQNKTKNKTKQKNQKKPKKNKALSLCISPDGTKVASTSGNSFKDLPFEDNTIFIWDTATGVLWRKLTGHIHKVFSLIF